MAGTDAEDMDVTEEEDVTEIATEDTVAETTMTEIIITTMLLPTLMLFPSTLEMEESPIQIQELMLSMLILNEIN